MLVSQTFPATELSGLSLRQWQSLGKKGFSPLESSQLWVIKWNYSQPAITGMAMLHCSSPSAPSRSTPTIQKWTWIQTKVPKMIGSRDASTIAGAVLAVLCWCEKQGRQRTRNAVLIYYDVFSAERKASFRIWVCKELFWAADLCAVRWCGPLPNSSATSSVVRVGEGKCPGCALKAPGRRAYLEVFLPDNFLCELIGLIRGRFICWQPEKPIREVS